MDSGSVGGGNTSAGIDMPDKKLGESKRAIVSYREFLSTLKGKGKSERKK